MARFRAYATDSEDEDDYSNEEVEKAVEDESEPEFPMHQSPPAQQSRLPVHELEDEDMYYDEEPEVDEERDSASPPPLAQRITDPSLTPWARQVGVDPQKMHVMQTSLFRVPEEAAAIQEAVQPRVSSRRKLVLTNGLNRKHSRDSEGEGLRPDSRQRASFAHDVDPAPFRPSRKYARVDNAASVVAGHEGTLIDSGLALGRSFRVGWGPGGTLAHLGSLCAPWGTSKETANSSVVQVAAIPIVPVPKDSKLDTEVDRISKLLAHNLNNTTIEPDADGVPIATPSRQISFASFASLFPSTDRSFEASFFRLGHALFDTLDLRLADSVSVDVRNKVTILRRKAALSRWLQSAVAPAVENDVREAGDADWAACVFAMLTGHQIEKACDTAFDAGNVKLSTLLAQAGGDDEFKGDLRAQLAIWREQKIDVHIKENVRKVYALLAGIVDVLEGSKGSGIERCPDALLARGLDWKRAFGLHLWFGQPLDASIADAFGAYTDILSDKDEAASLSVASPVPWYVESSSYTAGSSAWKLPGGAEPPDAMFSLIKLFANPACSLSQILSPLSFGPSPLDSRLPWHLYIILSRCLRLRDFADRGDPGVRHGREDDAENEAEPEVEGHSPSADLLASSYALQLEQMGMLQEAVFVLLHIEGSSGRRRAIKDMLARNAPKLDDWMTRGVVGSLKIPMAWVNEAKATYALSEGNVFEAYELYLAAGLYNPAHELAVLELAPDAVIRQDLELLKQLFQKIAGNPVDGWHVRGKAFLDYAHAMTRLPELRERLEDVDAPPEVAEEVEELTRSVPRLIGVLADALRDRADVRHNAALAEMISGLTLRLDQLRPLALGSILRTANVAESTKLHHIRSTAYEKFLRTIEVA